MRLRNRTLQIDIYLLTYFWTNFETVNKIYQRVFEAQGLLAVLVENRSFRYER